MSAETGRPRTASRTIWVYRGALLVGVPVLFFAGLELGLRVCGFGHPSSFLIPDEKPGCYRTNPDFVSLFLPGNFDLRSVNFRVAKDKPANTLRVVVLGESAAQGIPVPTFGFANQLRVQLRARYPGREIEVLNTGIVAINSHVVYQVARDLVPFHPDLFVVYMGNNEVVGPYGPGCAYLSDTPPLWVIRLSVFARSTRIGQGLSWILARAALHSGKAAEWGGMAMFVQNAVRGDDPRLDVVYQNYRQNLRDIVHLAMDAGAKTLLCTVVSNLKDCPPLLSVHRPGLAPAELAAWEEKFTQGRLSWKLGDPDARPALEAALKIDPTYADAWYMLGSLALAEGEAGRAREDLVQAQHWDALRFRPDPRINEIVRQVAAQSGPSVGLLDAALEMGSDPQSVGPRLAGREILFEHVHFDWAGNEAIAAAMSDWAVKLLGGAAPGSTSLESAAVARAMGYTEHERLPMLLRIEVLVRKPPFSNQLTYPEDEGRLSQAIAAATERARSPEVLRSAFAEANAAIAADPANPLLAGILEGIDLDLGDLPGALIQARRAKGLLPREFALDADEASILMQLGRYDESESILLSAARSGADLDLLAPVYADFYSRTKRFDEGFRFLDQALAKRPGDRRLLIVRASLLRVKGDLPAAEAGFGAVLRLDPSNEEALEGLIQVFGAEGKNEEVDRQSLASGDFQMRNQANDLRAAKVVEAKGDAEAAIRYLAAAERSGPANATFELSLALKYYQQHRMDEMLLHVAEARLLSLGEGRPSVTASIDALILRMKAEIAASRR